MTQGTNPMTNQPSEKCQNPEPPTVEYWLSIAKTSGDIQDLHQAFNHVRNWAYSQSATIAELTAERDAAYKRIANIIEVAGYLQPSDIRNAACWIVSPPHLESPRPAEWEIEARIDQRNKEIDRVEKIINLCLEKHYSEVKAERDAAIQRADKLQKFKDLVHDYFDSKGVPHHPPGTHGEHGCRIGDRLDWVWANIRQSDDLRFKLQERAEAAEAKLARLDLSHCFREPVKEATTPQELPDSEGWWWEWKRDRWAVREIRRNKSGDLICPDWDCDSGFEIIVGRWVKASPPPAASPEATTPQAAEGETLSEFIDKLHWQGHEREEFIPSYLRDRIVERAQSAIDAATADLRAENAELKAELAKGARNG